MFTCRFFRTFNFFATIATLFLFTNHYCFCQLIPKPINGSYESNGFSRAVATWQGAPTGEGSGKVCGFADAVTDTTFNRLTAAGDQFLFKSGEGCGSCYQIVCTENQYCNGNPITVTITNECKGSCNNVVGSVHFDVSDKALAFLAKRRQVKQLRNFGRVNILYQSVPCHYNASVTFKIDAGSNRYYLAMAIEYIDSGDLDTVEIYPANRGPLRMQRSFGGPWSVGLPEGVSGPYSVNVTAQVPGSWTFAKNVIPANWAPGQYYYHEYD